MLPGLEKEKAVDKVAYVNRYMIWTCFMLDCSNNINLIYHSLALSDKKKSHCKSVLYMMTKCLCIWVQIQLKAPLKSPNHTMLIILIICILSNYSNYFSVVILVISKKVARNSDLTISQKFLHSIKLPLCIV